MKNTIRELCIAVIFMVSVALSASAQQVLDVNVVSGTVALPATTTVNIANTDANTLATSIDTDAIATATVAINAKMVSGTDIGDVTINNATGAAAVPIQDGGNTITVDGTVGISTGTVDVGNAGGASAVNIQDGGNTITVDGAVTAVVTGAVSISTGTVDVGTVTTLPAITGAVTANAGTNLNTSALALESGGNLAAIAVDADAIATATAIISGDTTAIDSNTAPLTTVSQSNMVTVAAGATGSISCAATSSAITFAVTGATGATYYSFTGDATGDPRMIMFQNEKYTSHEGLKLQYTTINLYNPTAATAYYFIECWR